MKIVSSIAGVAEKFRPSQGIRDIKKAGFGNAVLDLNLICSIEALWPGREKVWADDLSDKDKMRESYRMILDTGAKEGLEFPVAHVPYLKSVTKRKDLDDKVRIVALESLHACEDAGCGYVIVPPLFAGVQRGSEWKVNREYYLELAAACQKKDTKILLKNQCRNAGEHLIRGNCADADEAVAWIRRLNDEVGTDRFAFCLDAGVCNLCGQDMREIITSLEGYVEAVILRDNDGQSDTSLLPFTCYNFGPMTDWLGLIRGLRDTCFDGLLIIDYSDTGDAFSPLLKPGLLDMAFSVADFFRWQIELESAMKRYDSIVLFGAGNMCRNYMKNYGDKYPPLFTCDNSSTRWGEEFCGLEVRSPEALRDIPKNCGVFICNIYYREIEKQLRDMGIENIEYFNDEYMPSFHQTRIERK